jgi:hypothetical protein
MFMFAEGKIRGKLEDFMWKFRESFERKAVELWINFNLISAGGCRDI